jgi:uroporphyrinogen decarboxylase
MTGREVALMALEQKRTPRVPVGLITGGEWYVHLAGKTFAEIKADPKKIAEVFIDAFRTVGQDLLWTGAGLLNYPIHCLGCAIKDDTSDSPTLIGTVVQNLDSIDALDIDKALKHPTMQAVIHSHHLIADTIGKETVIMPTQWGPLTVAARILGAEALMMATMENPDKLSELLDFATELIWATGGQSLDHPDIVGMNISDPVASGDMISPAVFRQFVAPFLKNLVKRIEAKEKYASIHICGDSTPILEDILDMKPTCFSLESKVDLKTAKEKLGGKVCVLGNVSPTGKFLSGSPEDVLKEGKECLAAWGDAPGYILTVGCDFSKQVPLSNVMALMELKTFVK